MDKQYNQGNPNQSEHGAAQTAPAPDHDVNEVDDMATAKSIKAPAFQFYPGDFLSSDNVDRMSMTERGVYITLMAKYWLAGDLPADMADLASMVRMKTAQFERMWTQGRLHLCFEERNGRLTQRRLESERKKQAEYKRRQSDNGLKGGRPKKAVVTSGLTQPQPAGKPTESSSSSSSSLSSFSSPSSSSKERNARDVDPPLDRWFRELQGLYPPKAVTSGHLSETAFCDAVWMSLPASPTPLVNASERFALMLANLETQKAGAQWGKGMIPRLDRWLREGLWQQQHEPAVLAGTAKTAGNVEALKRFIARGEEIA